MSKTWLITGASSGLGRLMTERLLGGVEKEGQQVSAAETAGAEQAEREHRRR